MNYETCNLDTRTTIDKLAQDLYDPRTVIRVSDIARSLKQQTDSDYKEYKNIQKQLADLRPQYFKYRDLEAQANTKAERLRRSMSLLGTEAGGDITKDDDLFSSFVVTLGDLTLWEAIAAVLDQLPEIQIYELQHVLDQFGKKTSRQAIESAIATHKEMFTTKTRGREKFVSLKR